MHDAKTLYLDLLKRALLNLIYLDAEGPGEAARRVAREDGRDRPPFALTMIGVKRLDNVIEAVRSVIAQGVPGDLVECGVWRGGAAAMMAGVLEALGDRDRKVWLADSFRGLPPPDPRYPADADDMLYKDKGLAVSRETVAANLARFGLDMTRFRFIEGFFEDSLAKAEVGRIALLRLDGDMYGSTMVALDALYDKVAPGGYVIIDDYGCYESCRSAVRDFMAKRGETVDPIMVDWTGAFWRKR